MARIGRGLAVALSLLIVSGLASSSALHATRPAQGAKRPAPAARSRAGMKGGPASAGVRMVPDEILVTFREGTADPGRLAALGAAHATALRRFRLRRDPAERLNRTYLARVAPGPSLQAALEAIRRRPEVEAAQPNFLYHALQAPDDPYYNLQWAQENLGGTPTYTAWGLHGPDPWLAGTDIEAEEARTATASMTFTPVIVGVIDTGMDLTHPDLAPSLWINPGEIAGNGVDDDGNGYVDDVNGWDFAYNDNDPLDGDGHGTHTAGVVGAVTGNGLGVAGTAPNAELMPLKFLDDSGSGSTSDAIDAILYGIDNGAQVLSNSWGGGSYDAALLNAIQAARSAGILFVAAAGNEASDSDVAPHYPSSYDVSNVISVAASTPWRDLAEFSNWGVTSVDLAAPGDEIISTTPVSGSTGFPETAYQICIPTTYPGLAPWSGTSMATPAVSGAGAILYGLGDQLWPASWPTWSAVERLTAVRDRILERAARWPSLSGSMVTEGHLNLFNLVEDDTTPPDPVGVSLQPVARGAGFVTLSWTATGDDGSTGVANYYVILYQEGPAIDPNTATLAEAVWTPGPAGSTEHYTVTGLQPDTEYTFGLEVVDNAGNRSARTDLTVTTLSALVAFQDDMESGVNGWTASVPWAQTTSTSSSPSHSWTDSPGGDYAANVSTSLISPPIPTGGGPISMGWTQRYEIETGWDFGYVEARSYKAGTWGSWTAVATFTGTDTTWRGVQAQLPVTGEQIQVRFRLESDITIEADGWYVDDVILYESPASGPMTVLLSDSFDGDDCSLWFLSGDWGCESSTLSDSPGADYGINNRSSAQLAAPLDLTGTQDATVSFDLPSFSYESGYDFLFFEYSLDGTSWRRLARMTGSTPGSQSFDLSDLAGQPAVYMRFVSLSDYGITEAGAQIDNFVVTVHELPGCTLDADCDDGLICNGTESCDLKSFTCQAGTPPVLDDGVGCTIDSCDEAAGVLHTPDDGSCDDGDACTTNTCDPVLDCQSAPVPGCMDADGDGVQDVDDNCVAVPNGPLSGTCVSGTPGAPCLDSGDCGGAGGPGLCSLGQEDLDLDGTGDACDPDQDGDGVEAAQGDCDDRASSVYPGAPEVCDGLDNDCDGTTDNALPPPDVTNLTLAGDTLSWDAVPGAFTYDVVGGNLEGMAVSGLGPATKSCAAENTPASPLSVPGDPVPGAGFWFLARAAHCGGSGSYGPAEPPAVPTRDEAISLSGNDCLP